MHLASKRKFLICALIIVLLLCALSPLYRRYMIAYNAGVCAKTRVVVVFDYNSIISGFSSDTDESMYLEAMEQAVRNKWTGENVRLQAESISFNSEDQLEVTGICPFGCTQRYMIDPENHQMISDCDAAEHIPVMSQKEVTKSLKWY